MKNTSIRKLLVVTLLAFLVPLVGVAGLVNIAGAHYVAPPSAPATGLIFASNGVANSAAALDWTGANMSPRFSHTSIWRAKYVQQTGYYAVNWWVLSNDMWGSGASGWELGTHPYPTDGNHDGNGYSAGSGGSGTVHYHEIANGFDKISNGGSGLLVSKATWLLQAEACSQVSTDYVCNFWPDVDNNPSFVITWTEAVASVSSDPGIKHRKGGSPWTQSGNTNSESVSGTLRFFLDYDTALTLPQIQAKGALTSDDTTDPNIWYSNINPTPTDVTDKSGKGHNPTWANASRPTLCSAPCL